MIDARYKGIISRFANHLCRPNCVVQRWEVAVEICCGLFANCNIAEGDEVTFNYGDLGTTPTTPCYCGQINCKGLF
ncbi:SET domain protein [Phytophthora megakarya]|uniref:SET domain protein n=1 Tax=Phytophthora megakarya TaxID=4795 RepID=A0A225UE04_9STRA|nr:SET domain protein [Phytophthora megakarya]